MIRIRRYSPILQPTLLPLYILTEVLCELATRITVANPNLDTPGLYQVIKRDPGVEETVLKLEEQKQVVLRHVTAVGSLAMLYRSHDIAEQGERYSKAEERFDASSKTRTEYRRKYLDAQIAAVGAPQSLERRTQLLHLMGDSSFTLDNPHCVKGSPLWTEILQDVPEGQALMLTWIRSRPASEKV